MKQIIDTTIAAQSESISLDFLKADFVLTTQHLIELIFYSLNGMGAKNEKDMSFAINHLIDAKDLLIDRIGTYMKEVDKLSEEIENYLKYGNNGTDIFCEYCNDGRERCRECEVCTYDIEEYPRKPTDVEIEAEIEREIAQSEARADRM